MTKIWYFQKIVINLQTKTIKAKIMTYTQIRSVLENDKDCGREWWVDKFISTKEKPNDILWIGGYGSNNTIYAENSKGEEVEIFYDETPLCVTFLGAIRIDSIKVLEHYWRNRIAIHEQIKRDKGVMSSARPPFTTFVEC